MFVGCGGRRWWERDGGGWMRAEGRGRGRGKERGRTRRRGWGMGDTGEVDVSTSGV